MDSCSTDSEASAPAGTRGSARSSENISGGGEGPGEHRPISLPDVFGQQACDFPTATWEQESQAALFGLLGGYQKSSDAGKPLSVSSLSYLSEMQLLILTAALEDFASSAARVSREASSLASRFDCITKLASPSLVLRPIDEAAEETPWAALFDGLCGSAEQTPQDYQRANVALQGLCGALGKALSALSETARLSLKYTKGLSVWAGSTEERIGMSLSPMLRMTLSECLERDQTPKTPSIARLQGALNAPAFLPSSASQQFPFSQLASGMDFAPPYDYIPPSLFSEDGPRDLCIEGSTSIIALSERDKSGGSDEHGRPEGEYERTEEEEQYGYKEGEQYKEGERSESVKQIKGRKRRKSSVPQSAVSKNSPERFGGARRRDFTLEEPQVNPAVPETALLMQGESRRENPPDARRESLGDGAATGNAAPTETPSVPGSHLESRFQALDGWLAEDQLIKLLKHRKLVRSNAPGGPLSTNGMDVTLALMAASGYVFAVNYDTFDGCDLSLLKSASQTRAFIIGMHATAKAMEFMLPYFLAPLLYAGPSGRLYSDKNAFVGALTLSLQDLRVSQFDYDRACYLASDGLIGLTETGELDVPDLSEYWNQIFGQEEETEGVVGKTAGPPSFGYALSISSGRGFFSRSQSALQDRSQEQALAMTDAEQRILLDTQPPGGFDTATYNLFPATEGGAHQIYSWFHFGPEQFRDEDRVVEPRVFEPAMAPAYIWLWLLHAQPDRNPTGKKMLATIKSLLLQLFYSVDMKDLPLTEGSLYHIFGAQGRNSSGMRKLSDRRLFINFVDQTVGFQKALVDLWVDIYIRCARVYYRPEKIYTPCVPDGTFSAASEAAYRILRPGLRYWQTFVAEPEYIRL